VTEDGVAGTGWRWSGPERVRNHPGPESTKGSDFTLRLFEG
jgi:hypothetical protein